MIFATHDMPDGADAMAVLAALDLARVATCERTGAAPGLLDCNLATCWHCLEGVGACECTVACSCCGAELWRDDAESLPGRLGGGFRCTGCRKARC